MPNDTTTTTHGNLVVETWDAGWQRQPWNPTGGEVFGRRVRVTSPEWPALEYVETFCGSIHDAQRDVKPTHEEAVACVLEEMAWWDWDADEFTDMLIGYGDEPMTAERFTRAAKVVAKLEHNAMLCAAAADFASSLEGTIPEELGVD